MLQPENIKSTMKICTNKQLVVNRPPVLVGGFLKAKGQLVVNCPPGFDREFD